MFSEPTIRDFCSRFPTLPEPEVRRMAEWVDSRNASNPSAMLESVLAKARDARAAQPDNPRAHVREHRGTFRPDGSWWDDANLPSETEHALRDAAGVIARNLLPPRDALDLFKSEPLAGIQVSEGQWKLLTGESPPDVKLAGVSRRDWCLASWYNAHVSNPATEWFKRRVIANLTLDSARATGTTSVSP